MTPQQKVAAVAKNTDGEVRYGYSGRGMFGKRCMGIVCKNSNECLEVAGANGLRGGLIDNMGLDYIVYWPSVPSITDEEDDE